MWTTFLSPLFLPCLLTGTSASSVYVNESSFLYNHQWIPAALVPNSSRSPCPLLNTLANHGFLPRDGRNITKADFNNAQIEALNFDYDLASGTTNAMVAKLGTPINTSSAFNLHDFSAHNRTEHDASVTRLDILQGSNSDVDPGLVKLFLQDSVTEYITAQTIGLTRLRRELESLSIGSPPLSSAFTHFAQLESSFMPLVFGIPAPSNDSERRAPKPQLKEWLNDERFPIEDGFDRPTEVLTKGLQDKLIEEIARSYEAWKNVSVVLFPEYAWGVKNVPVR